MATYYLSDYMINGGAVVHGENGGQEVEVTGIVRIPAGTDLAAGDRLVFMRFPEGTIFLEEIFRCPDLDDGAGLTLDLGYQRPLVDPGKAYDATTNPYTDNAIATADDDFFEEDSTIGQAGGIAILAYAGFTVTSQGVTGVAGDVDLCATVAIGAATASTAGGQVKWTVRALLNDEQTMGAFSGRDALNYTTNYDI